mmetsp:Transcript_165615/g.526669  ORF Transcript_165615/g.526669 Transcript_165615/m.526669 type:complete len:223 (+) Transcript_165615:130-798(+)
MPIGINLFGKANAPEAQKDSAKEMMNDWKRRMRTEGREIERGIRKIEQEENKIKKDIQVMAAKGADPVNIKMLTKSLVRSRKAKDRLYTTRATMQAIESELQCTAATMRLNDAMKGSAAVMKQINAVSNVPEVHENMAAIQKEMLRAGLIEEMMDEGMDALDGPEVEEEAEAELDKVLEDLAIDASMRALVLRPQAAADAAVAAAAPAAAAGPARTAVADGG